MLAIPHILQVIIIAIIEGLTEFLPVSSTGHMALAGMLMGFEGEQEKSFQIIIQLGAILAVCVVYWQRLWNVARGLLTDKGSQLFARNVIIAVVPSMVLGLLTYKAIKAAMGSPVVIAWALIIGGIAILIIERLQHKATVTSVEGMPLKTAIGIGIAQCLSLIPGVSRSGATIMGALMLGVERKTAAEFTFFLAIPTMLAATTYDIYKSWSTFDASALSDLAIGFVVAFVVALAVVRSFVAFVGRFGFAPFAWYRIVVGVLTLIFLGQVAG